MAIEHFPIEAGHIELFCRAVGETSLECGGSAPLAPPTFVQAGEQFDPSSQLRPRPGEPWRGSPIDLGAPPPDSDGDWLHAEQHFEYHCPLRAGMVLRATTELGQEWEKTSRSGSVLRFAESVTKYYDAESDLIVTARKIRVNVQRAS